MTPVLIAAAVGLIAIALYAVFGGADFGGGVWDLLATGPRRDAQRTAITHAIGPVWEANHVWLIYAIVILFSCFPPAFADIATGVNAPLVFALVGIVLRGAAFVFRNYVDDHRPISHALTVVFGIASLLTPFWLGDAVGALATGRYDWLSPFALSVGVFAVAVCAQMAGVFLLHEVTDPLLRADFRRRAIGATVAVWITGAVPALLARSAEPAVFAALLTPTARGAIGVALVLGILVAIAVSRGADVLARLLVGAEAVAILLGWFGAQAPAIVPGRYTYISAASSDAMITAILIASACGAVLLVPSLVLLFAVFKGPVKAASAAAVVDSDAHA
ncbi:MAG: cytochrome d ubiquinol oxidase subunit II [Candidatus Velthaea sp.]